MDPAPFLFFLSHIFSACGCHGVERMMKAPPGPPDLGDIRLSCRRPPRLNMCPNNCSDRGECRVGNATASVYCECEAGWGGPACDAPSCPADCGFPDRGHCWDKTCLCESGWQGGLRAHTHTHTGSESS